MRASRITRRPAARDDEWCCAAAQSDDVMRRRHSRGHGRHRRTRPRHLQAARRSTPSSRFNPSAVAQAEALDRAAAAGEPKGPLFCMPVAVKDNFDTYDMPATVGSLALIGNQPQRDAPFVARLRAAGAIVVGKTNMDEFAMGIRGLSGAGGRVGNAYDTRRSAGRLVERIRRRGRRRSGAVVGRQRQLRLAAHPRGLQRRGLAARHLRALRQQGRVSDRLRQRRAGRDRARQRDAEPCAGGRERRLARRRGGACRPHRQADRHPAPLPHRTTRGRAPARRRRRNSRPRSRCCATPARRSSRASTRRRRRPRLGPEYPQRLRAPRGCGFARYPASRRDWRDVCTSGLIRPEWTAEECNALGASSPQVENLAVSRIDRNRKSIVAVMDRHRPRRPRLSDRRQRRRAADETDHYTCFISGTSGLPSAAFPYRPRCARNAARARAHGPSERRRGDGGDDSDWNCAKDGWSCQARGRPPASARARAGRRARPAARECAAASGKRLSSRTGQGGAASSRLASTRLQHVVLDEHLQPLRHPRREHAAALHGGEIVVADGPGAQRRGQAVRGRDRVLDREIDADAADRRHRVRRVADAQQPRPVPLRQAVDLDGQQLDVVPVCSSCTRSRMKRRDRDDGGAERVEALRLASRRPRPSGSRRRIASSRRGRSSRRSCRRRCGRAARRRRSAAATAASTARRSARRGPRP